MADVLLVDDDAELLQSLARVLSPRLAPRMVCGAGTSDKALDMVSKEKPLVVVMDLCIDERRGVESGFELLATLHTQYPSLRVLVLTGHGSTAHGVRAMELGAASFIEKPADPEHLVALIKDYISQAELRKEYAALARQRGTVLTTELCGTSSAIQQLREQVEFAASTNQSVLLVGETGTGKSLCARLIHERSARRHKKFVHYHPNFGGGDIAQSELFGHTKGAFTGALESRRGIALEADGGTLFIDELDEVPAEIQVKLLDVVQERRVRPVGADTFQPIDTRFIAATNRPLEEALLAGKIRRDLHHRLAHCIVSLPSLRHRLEDIGPLADSFLAALCAREGLNVFELSVDARKVLQSYDWPGNIRELQGIVESGAYRAHFRQRAVVEAVDVDLRGTSGGHAPQGNGDGSFQDQVEAFKRRLVRDALQQCEGNVAQTARLLGVDRGTVRRLS